MLTKESVGAMLSITLRASLGPLKIPRLTKCGSSTSSNTSPPLTF